MWVNELAGEGLQSEVCCFVGTQRKSTPSLIGKHTQGGSSEEVACEWKLVASASFILTSCRGWASPEE